MKSRLLSALFLLGVLLSTAGCPAAQHYEQRLDRPPRQIERFDASFPDAQDVTYYRSRQTRSGLSLEHTTDYRVHFRVGDQWYLARYTASGWLESVDPSDADFLPSPYVE